MKLDKTNDLFTWLCGERVTHGEVIATGLGIFALLLACSIAECLMG